MDDVPRVDILKSAYNLSHDWLQLVLRHSWLLSVSRVLYQMAQILSLAKLQDEVVVSPCLNDFVKLADIGMIKVLKNSYFFVQSYDLSFTLHL